MLEMEDIDVILEEVNEITAKDSHLLWYMNAMSKLHGEDKAREFLKAVIIQKTKDLAAKRITEKNWE